MNHLSLKKRSLALSFTGSGHLLVYQLGVAKVLQRYEAANDSSFDIPVVAGSSGGAIVATLMAFATKNNNSNSKEDCLIQDYASKFIDQRGGGLDLLQSVLIEQHKKTANLQNNKDAITNKELSKELHICTTRNFDGKAIIHTFTANPFFCLDDNNNNAPLDSADSVFHHLIQCVLASCTFCPSFHPIDIFYPKDTAPTYPDEDGVELCVQRNNNNDTNTMPYEWHCDGGIAAPAPPTPPEYERVVVCPIVGTNKGKTKSYDHRISPVSKSSFFAFHVTARGGLRMEASLQNFQAAGIASGMSATSAELQSWLEQGEQDAERWVSSTV